MDGTGGVADCDLCGHFDGSEAGDMFERIQVNHFCEKTDSTSCLTRRIYWTVMEVNLLA